MPTIKSDYDTDVVRLIGHHLIGLGMNQTVEQLLKESGISGLDNPVAAKLQQHILAGEWDKTPELIEKVAEYSPDVDRKNDLNEIKFLIAEQKFFELLEDEQHIQALKCLRLELTPITDDTKRVQNLATMLMCRSIEEVRQKADWPGKGMQSRRRLMEKIQRFIPPMIMLPPKRLDTLLSQAIQLQKERCVLHLDEDTDGISDLAKSYVDLKKDHVCSSSNFPLELRQEVVPTRSEVWYCKWSNDGSKLATGSLGGIVKIWDLDVNLMKLTERCSFDCNSYSITCLSWSPNDMYLVTCGAEENGDKPDLYIWHVEKEEVYSAVKNVEEDSFTTCAWHHSGDKFAAAGTKGNFVIFGLNTLRKGCREGVRVQCLSFLNKDSDHILAADVLHRIKSYAIRDMSLETEEEDILEERHPIMSFTIDREDRYIAINLMDQGVHLWDYKSRSLLKMFPGVSQRNFTIYSSFCPKGTFIASGSEDGKVYIYNVQREQPVAILHGHGKCVNCVTWNPKHSQLLVSASDDRTIRLWGPAPLSEVKKSDAVQNGKT